MFTITARFDASIERVWRIWSDPRQLERWWGPPSFPATVTEHRAGARRCRGLLDVAGMDETTTTMPGLVDLPAAWSSRTSPRRRDCAWTCRRLVRTRCPSWWVAARRWSSPPPRPAAGDGAESSPRHRHQHNPPWTRSTRSSRGARHDHDVHVVEHLLSLDSYGFLRRARRRAASGEAGPEPLEHRPRAVPPRSDRLRRRPRNSCRCAAASTRTSRQRDRVARMRRASRRWWSVSTLERPARRSNTTVVGVDAADIVSGSSEVRHAAALARSSRSTTSRCWPPRPRRPPPGRPSSPSSAGRPGTKPIRRARPRLRPRATGAANARTAAPLELVLPAHPRH